MVMRMGNKTSINYQKEKVKYQSQHLQKMKENTVALSKSNQINQNKEESSLNQQTKKEMITTIKMLAKFWSTLNLFHKHKFQLICSILIHHQEAARLVKLKVTTKAKQASKKMKLLATEQARL